ncbi:hypothetical protein LZZ85_14135 [Terrimonas sp. NA20]|uniref:Curli production assembly/transport component CsgG n=1 Tax=Terrimonas ginsenosidimutans TaxID=2908004 RepID=A0ABS9KSX8_9BACT|nr:hypothetical protein [Terrimonas ginsenosidimutans]MCG2615434.1 hypothetical protein [Terrimonas ginsenosidimutans]
MRLLFTMILSFAGVLSAFSQTLGDFKPKDHSGGLRKIKSKRLYVASFTVNYQVFNEKEEFKQGGRMFGGGGSKGDAKAELSVGLEGLTEAGVQGVTDKLYQDFTAMLKANGIELITPEEAGKTDTYDGFVKLTGGTISEAQFPGMLATVPTGMEYYVKKIDKSGKEKSGGLFGNANFVHAKLSKDLDDAIVADVDLFVLFIEDKSSWDVAGANIKVKTNMRLAGQESIEMTKKAKIKFKGENTQTPVNSQVGFYSGKMGAGIVSSYTGSLGKSMPVSGVIEDQKIQAFAKNKVDMVGVSTIYGKYYNPADNSSSSTTIIPVDDKKYAEGAYLAGKKFIEYHTEAFLKEIK